ncbi:MAG TPA: polymorphic toxin-type HINT domain-containing protein [Candidatus Bipolaricaulota bacterium]|nr:polymorphic toxin-type HINT domain-containing protein [Candidatus Bipolaricaulota bacterium]
MKNMENNLKNDGFNQEINSQNRNDFETEPLKEADMINKAKFKAEPASQDFQQALKSKILAARSAKQSMNKFDFSKVISAIKPKNFAPVMAFILIIAIVFTTVHFWPDSRISGPFKTLSGLMISPAHAEDNFDVQPTLSDSIGVETSTAFIIKSKDKLDSDLLKENISLIPQTEFDFEKISDYEFKVTPKNILEGKKVYNLKIEAAYVNDNGIVIARDFSWAFQVKDQFKIINTLPKDKAYNVPLNSGIEVTFSHEDIKNYEKNILIEPKVEGRFEKHKRTVVFVPKGLSAGTIYTVTVKKAIELPGSDSKMENDYVFQFETTSSVNKNYYSGVSFVDNYMEFTTSNQAAFQVYSYGNELETAAQIPMTIYSFKSENQFVDAINKVNDIPSWAYYSNRMYSYDISALNKADSFELALQEYGYSNYLLLPENLSAGYYLAEVDYQGRRAQTYFVVTDISAYSMLSENKILVWVNDLKTKEPIANADVQIVGSSVSAKTDKNGVATIDTGKILSLTEIKEQRLENNYLMKISADNKAVIIPLSADYYYLGENESDQYWNYFFSDRSMYKPNDTLNFWGFAQSRNGQENIDKVKISLTEFDYKNYYYESIDVNQVVAEVSGGGTFSGKMDLKSLTPGYYSLDFYINDNLVSRRSISIEDYIKPAYSLNIVPEKKAIIAGEPINIDVNASFFEGTPVPNLALSYNADKEDKTIKTDARGDAKITISTNASKLNDDCIKTASCHLYESSYRNVNISQLDSEEADIYDTVTIRLYNAAIQAGARFEAIGNNKAKIETRINNIDFDELNAGEASIYNAPVFEDESKTAVANATFQAAVTEITYVKNETGEYYDFINKVVKKTYDYDRQENVVLVYDGKTDANGKHIFELNIDPEKSYQVQILTKDAAGRQTIADAYMSGNYQPSLFSQYELKFKNKDDDYSATFDLGEKVDVSFNKDGVQLPAGGKDYLYLNLQKGLMNYFVSDAAEYAFEFEEKHIPNVNVKGVFFDGQAYHEANSDWYLGFSQSIIARYNSLSKELNIAVKADKDKYEPGEKVTLDVKVSDRNNKAKKTDVNFSLVDEAFFSLSDQTVMPLDTLYEPVSTGLISTYKSHDYVKFMGGGGAEGGGCFAAGTKITMADGSKKNIEDVKEGDEILTFENERAIKTVSAKVVETFEHTVSGYLLINDSLRVTPEHRMFINSGWQMIGEAKVNDMLMDESGQLVRIEKIAYEREIVKVYNLHIEKYHTFFANGIYVHNEKGGARVNFLDVALFQTVSTNAKGEGQVSFTLPDNLTSWRVTCQAINQDLFAGSSVINIPVSLPVFVQPNVSSEYLSKDKPIIKMTAYGTELTSKDPVSFNLKSETLGINEKGIAGAAFVPNYYQIESMPQGQHELELGVESSKGNDGMIKKITVLASRLRESAQRFYTLSDDLKVEGGAAGLTKLTFSDLNQGSFYWTLQKMSWTVGDRVDQKLSRIIGDELLLKYFNENKYEADDLDASLYQDAKTGISLFPYSGGDYELTAKIAAVAADHFDKNNLANYFYAKLNSDKSTREEVALALFGLAGLDEPVLLPVQAFAKIEDLPVIEKLYIGLALEKLGDGESARSILKELLDDYGDEKAPYAWLKAGSDQDDILRATSLAAVLAGGLNHESHEALWRYVRDNRTDEVLVNLEQLMYTTFSIDQLRPGESSFSYELNGEVKNISLEKGSWHQIYLSPEQLSQIKFSNISGKIGVVSGYEIAATAVNSEENGLKISREYYVNGKKTNTFKDTDLVQVRINYSFDAAAVQGEYEVVDSLPSGLRIVTNPFSRYREFISSACGLRYPYEISGQRVKFGVWKTTYSNYCNNGEFTYFARVVNPGEYEAEPVLLQSIKSSELKRYSESSRITIEK